MRQILQLSLLLIIGLVLSQVLPWLYPQNYAIFERPIQGATMVCLSYIMIHVGFEFTIDKDHLGKYGWDYVVAMTAAAFPWLFCAMYFVYFLPNNGDLTTMDSWREGLLAARFAAPTSAGVLFSMLVAAGLGASWLFRKARILAIFDDLDTIIFMIPLKMIFIGFQWELVGLLFLIGILLWLAWRYLHQIPLPDSWGWVLFYSVLVMGFAKGVDKLSLLMGADIPIHFEVLLPAFVLGCVIRHPKAYEEDSTEFALGVFDAKEKRVAHIISACFMVFVGLSMPPLLVGETAPVVQEINVAEGVHASDGALLNQPGAHSYAVPGGMSLMGDMDWTEIAFHVLMVTLLMNLGKMFPAFCYRQEASLNERLALALGMWPRGEVGAGVIVISVALGIQGPMIVVGLLALALNLVFTGVFIWAIKVLIGHEEPHTVTE